VTGPAPLDGARDTAWARDPDALERVFHAALERGDATGVEAALTLMSGVDPGRMVRLANELRDALVVAKFLNAGSNDD